MLGEEICPLTGNICDKHKCHQIKVHGISGQMLSNTCEDCVGNLSELKTMETPQNPKNIFELLFGGVKTYFEEIVKKKQDQLALVEKKSEDLGPCPSCNMSLFDIAKIGRMGCPTCYEKFGNTIREILAEINNPSKNENVDLKNKQKDPESVTPVISTNPIFNKESNDSLLKIKNYLTTELSNCVKKEDYENATVIRDLLKMLNSRISSS